MAKKYINTESDFTLLLNLPDGYDGDFRFVVSTDGRNSLKASRIDGVLDGCEVKDGQLYMVVRHGLLQPGHLRTKTYLWIDNEWVESLQQMVPAGEDIVITAGMTNTDASALNVDVIAPYLKVDPKRYVLTILDNTVYITANGVRTDYSTSQIGRLHTALDKILREGNYVALSTSRGNGFVIGDGGVGIIQTLLGKVLIVSLSISNGKYVLKEYDVTESIANKVQKRTETDNIMRVYYADGKGGQNAMRATTVADAGYTTIMTRSADGRTSVGTPTAAMNAVNKKYVDDIQTELEARIAALEAKLK